MSVHRILLPSTNGGTISQKEPEMRKAGFAMMSLCLMFLVLSVAAPAAAAPMSDDEFVASLNASPQVPPEPVNVASIGGDPIPPATCTASCAPYGSVSCSGSSCSAVDRNCSAGQCGYAKCGSTYYYCPSCPPPPPPPPSCSQCTGPSECGETGGNLVNGICQCC